MHCLDGHKHDSSQCVECVQPGWVHVELALDTCIGTVMVTQGFHTHFGCPTFRVVPDLIVLALHDTLLLAEVSG